MKTKMLKRIAALSASAAMLFTCADLSAISLSASALRGGVPDKVSYDVDGDGIITVNETAYELDSLNDLVWFIDNARELSASPTSIDQNAVLAADIDLSEDTDKMWLPIGCGSAEDIFSGVFDGQGHTISNLKWDSSYNHSEQYTYWGLFTRNKGTIKNLGMVNCEMTDCAEKPATIGGICGENKGKITNCYVLDGKLDGSSTTECLGGICGENSGSIVNSYNTGDVSSATYVGGICGKTSGILMNCYSSCSISDGVCGSYDGGLISDCYFSGRKNGLLFGIGHNSTGGTPNSAPMDAEQFANGELCWALNGKNAENPVFFQTLGTDTIPTLDNTHKTVYCNTACDGVSKIYTNDNKDQTHSYQDGICKNCGAFEDGIGARLAGTSISLNGSIGVSFYMELADSVIADENAYLLVDYPNGSDDKLRVDKADTAVIGDKTYYIFQCDVAATEMTDTISARMMLTHGEGTKYNYSVKEYADYLLAHTEENTAYADAADLVKAMLNYGAYAQLLKGYKTNTLPCQPTDLSDVTIPTHSYSGQDSDNVKFAGANLSMLALTTLRLFFEIKDAADVQVFHGAKPLEIGENNGLSYVEIPNILPQDLGNDMTVIIEDGAESLLLIYSPMTYCYLAASRDRDAKLVNLVKALSLFGKEASNYIGG